MKVFRIIDNKLSQEGRKAYHPLFYKIEQRRTILFFIHWWSTPDFAPPHYFETVEDAVSYIRSQYPKARIKKRN